MADYADDGREWRLNRFYCILYSTHHAAATSRNLNAAENDANGAAANGDQHEVMMRVWVV